MNILITGPSGSGKSTIGKLLQERGFDVIEADTDKHQGTSIAYYQNKISGIGVNMPWPPPKNWHDENNWVWRVVVLDNLLKQSLDKINFVVGDARNKAEAYPIFDKVLFLSTDDQTLKKRIMARHDNYFGKDPVEFAWIVEENKRLKAEATNAGGIIIDSSIPVNEVADKIIALVYT